MGPTTLSSPCAVTVQSYPTPTAEDLTVFYIPDHSVWQETSARMQTAGFRQVTAFNPYWELHGRTFQDRDGYLIVLQNAESPTRLNR
jgi:hypothetical protein